jgi:hypothetical protein
VGNTDTQNCVGAVEGHGDFVFEDFSSCGRIGGRNAEERSLVGLRGGLARDDTAVIVLGRIIDRLKSEENGRRRYEDWRSQNSKA